jgi:prevent-host-death family protein
MARVTLRELRTHAGKVVDRASGGELITITRAGKPVAELRPVAPPALSASALLARWRRLPPVDPSRLRTDLDDALDAGL